MSPRFVSLCAFVALSRISVLGAEAVSNIPAHPALAVLEQYCVKCHGGEKTKAGFDLTTREALLRGGESGEAITPGQPEKSLLYRMVTHEEDPGMPHKEDKLPDNLIAEIAAWIRADAPYAHKLNGGSAGKPKAEFAITESDRAHWAFQPVKQVTPPPVKNASWAKTPIDTFLLATMEAKGLRPSSAAARETLIRRVTLDLVGLPPTVAEIDAFLNDKSPQAYDALIDRLLASPHYGERWGRHWLDLARFAETDGFEHDAVRPHAWRYRDYVVRAFNADKPYDRFVREQIAGDELFPDEPDGLIATAFNLLGPDMVDSADQIQRRRNTLNDMTDTTALAFLGLTLGCARCHDHKFEPYAQRDYYALQAFYASAKFRNDMPVPSKAERAAYETALAAYNEQTKTLQEELTELEAPYRKSIFERKLSKLSPEAQAAHRTPPDQRNTEQQNAVLETNYLVEIAPKELLAAMKKPDRDRHGLLQNELKPYPKPKPLPASLALQDGPAVKSFVLRRGDYNQPGDEVFANFPDVLRPRNATQATPPSRRAQLADWMASPQNPLTARVFVNRVWQHHFGRGLVASPSDFGTHGQKPSHPALLDWLTADFVAHGWSVKHLHRVILLSAAYQQESGTSNQSSVTSESSTPSTDHRLPITDYSKDPDNRYYSRMNRLRLEGEVIRDSLLAISGQLNPKMGGPGVFPPIPKELFEGAKGWTASDKPEEYDRRSLYVFARRNLRFPFLEVFDAPDSNLSCAARDRSTTAPQSLTLLNADEVMTAAEALARRVHHDAATEDARVTLAYRTIIGRAPTEHERAMSLAFLAHSPLTEFCRALFNLNDFVYAE